MQRRIYKYARLLLSFWKASAIADMEYRLNLVMKIFTDVLWYAAQISLFEVLFSHTSQISGWTLSTTRIFMALLFATDALWMMFFSENLDRLSDKVSKGELDLILVKPVNAQFMMSLQKMSPAYIINFTLVVGWLVWSLMRLAEPPHWSHLAMLLVLIPCGLAATYSLKFLFSATAVIFTRAENINYIYYQIYRLGTRPDSIYPPWLRYAVLSILPVGFIASVPARFLLGPDTGETWLLVGFSLGMAVLSVALTQRYWRFALRFYSSASS